MLSIQEIVDLHSSKPLAAGFGLLSHYIFAKYELDVYFHIILQVWTAALVGITTALYLMGSNIHSFGDALLASTSTAAAYFATLLLSMTIYRAFFHRLRRFPGPFMARITKFYGVALATKQNQLYLETEKLHKKYGDYVRTGPRELSITDVDAIPVILGPTSKCVKGTWYLNAHHLEGFSLQTTPDKVEHRDRRRVWDRAFNAKALRDYEPRINRHARFLLDRLHEKSSEPAVRISSWLNFFSFDAMGDIGFNRSFGMLENGKEDKQIASLHNSMAIFTILTHVPWGMNLGLRTPFGMKDTVEFMDWTHKVLVARKKVTPKERDVFSWLLDDKEEEIPKNLNADARLMIVAGSDTTAASLTWLSYELCMNPEIQERLRKEIDKIAGDKTFLDYADVAEIPYLDGVINETLRFHPAVPSGVVRRTPPNGIRINSTYIPGNIHVWIPPHTIQRDPRYFAEPLSFLPERWTDEKPEMVIDKRALLVFSAGPYNCVGQKLAVMEMRSVVSNLVKNFKLEFAEGERGQDVIGKTRDCFTTNVGKLDVRLTPRNL